MLLTVVGAGLLAFFLWLAFGGARSPARPTPAPEAQPRLAARAAAPDRAPEDLAPQPTPTAPASRAAPLRHRAVEGVVTDGDEVPLVGVSVRLVLAAPEGRERTVEHTTRTDAAGHYDLAEATARPERLEFSAPGYEPRVFERPEFPQVPRVRWDATLTAEANIHGIVLGPEGPVSGAVLGLWVTEARTVSTVAQSDESGRFALAVPDGPAPYTLKARHSAQGEASLSVPGPGEFTVRLPGGGYIEGHVVDTARDPIQAFAVSAEPQQRRMMAQSVAQSFDSGDGAFRLGPVGAGRYSVRAAAEGFQPGEPRSVEVEAGQTLTDVTLVMKASGTLTGRVTDARTRAPIDGALVVPAEWSNGDLAESVGAVTDSDGRYRLKALPGKRSSINVSAEGYRPLLGGGLMVPPGKTATRDFALTSQRLDQRPVSELTGIGAVLAPRADGVAITQLVEGSPAARLLNAGDVVVSVDGRPTPGLPLGDVANAIRGELGTEVILLVKRDGQGNPERVVLRRERVTMPERGRGRPHGDPHGQPND